jgi:hypothetical protein
VQVWIVFEYSPKKVKQSVTGIGNADKEQVLENAATSSYHSTCRVKIPGCIRRIGPSRFAIISRTILNYRPPQRK